MPPQAALARSPASGPEQRLSPRTVVMRDGQAFRLDGLAAAVLIVDLSEGGARLRARGGQVLPDEFVLADPLTWCGHRARIVWRRDGEVGVKFLKSQNLRGVVPGALQPAKAFCERASR